MKYPKALNDLMESLQMLPGVGHKSAERLAFYIATKAPREKVEKLSNDLVQTINKITECSICHMITDDDICEVCKDSERTNKLMVVENSKDAIAIEKTGQYYGKYHILNGVISPLEGVSPNDLNLEELEQRIESENIEEVIVATNATMEGEVTARYINNLLKGKKVKITRIGYGLPAGADIEYADQITLIRALEGRTKIE